MAISKKVTGLILLAALDFASGERGLAARHLQRAAEEPDFEETLEDLSDVADGAGDDQDPFLTADVDDDEDDGLDLDGDGDEDVALLDDETASLVQAAKRRRQQASGGNVSRAVRNHRRRMQAATEDIDDGDSPGDADNDNTMDDNSGMIRQTARLATVRRNLRALASAK